MYYQIARDMFRNVLEHKKNIIYHSDRFTFIPKFQYNPNIFKDIWKNSFEQEKRECENTTKTTFVRNISLNTYLRIIATLRLKN